MKTFKIKALADWHQIVHGEILAFEPARSGRQLTMEFNVSETVRVMASPVADMTGAVMLAASDGQFAVEVSHEETLYVSVRADNPDASVYLKTRDNSHLVPKFSQEKITEVAPRRVRNVELDTMMAVMRHNEEMRDRKLAAEIRRIRAEMKPGDAKILEPVRTSPADEPVVEDGPADDAVQS